MSAGDPVDRGLLFYGYEIDPCPEIGVCLIDSIGGAGGSASLALQSEDSPPPPF